MPSFRVRVALAAAAVRLRRVAGIVGLPTVIVPPAVRLRQAAVILQAAPAVTLRPTATAIRLRGGKSSGANQQSRRNDQEANGPEEDSYYLYQKRLVDDIKKKVFRVSVYQDKVLGGKVCSIFCSANKNGTLNSGSVYLKSPELFDLINDVEDAIQHVEASGQPIEMLSDHDVYFRRHVTGLNNTFVGIEIIKHAREDSKEGLFLIGEKGRSSGVISEQTARQLAQIERILKEALSAMR